MFNISMLALLLLVIFGLGIAYFATQNVAQTTLYFAGYRFSAIPLYLIVIASMLLGIFVSWLISMIDAVSSMLALRGKDSAIKDAQHTIDALETKIHNLEVENASLKGETATTHENLAHEHEEHTRHEVPHPSFFSRLKQSFG